MTVGVPCRHSRILVDEFELTGETNGATIGVTSPKFDVTTWQATGNDTIPGWPDMMIEHQGFLVDVNAGSMERTIRERMEAGGQALVSVLIGHPVLPIVPVYTQRGAYSERMSIQMPVNNVLALQGTWPGRQSMRRGYLVHYGELSATGAQAGIDFGAAGTDGGHAILHVIGLTGTPVGADIDLEGDSDPGFGTASVIASFTVNERGAQEVSLAGAVPRYLRLNLTDLGGATMINAALIAHVKGRTF